MSDSTFPKSLFICPYFGALPKYLSVFLETASWNPDFDFLILTDQNLPSQIPANVKFETFELNNLNNTVSELLGFEVQKKAYSQCDLRPFYGKIFHEQLIDYKFWGHCDLDVIWGDLSKIFTPEKMNSADIISSQKEMISGHCTLYRNNEKINSLYKYFGNPAELFQNPDSLAVDEKAWTDLIKDQKINAEWHERLVAGRPELLASAYGWEWRNGRVFDAEKKEYPYIHFHAWKNSLKTFQHNATVKSSVIYINSTGFFQNKLPLHIKAKQTAYKIKKNL